MITGKEPYNSVPITTVKDSIIDAGEYQGELEGIPIGLEIMSRYVAAMIENPLYYSQPKDNGKTFEEVSRRFIPFAKELTDLTLKVWNDGNT